MHICGIFVCQTAISSAGSYLTRNIKLISCEDAIFETLVQQDEI